MPDDTPPAPPAISSAALRRYAIALALIAAAVIVYGVVARHRAGSDLRRIAGEAALPNVSVVHPAGRTVGDDLVLPGNIEAYNSVAIYARTNGYVRRWLTDIGDTVRAGQPLAELDAPELDQQLAQARANHLTAMANRRLAETSAARWRTMLAKDAVSRQEVDEREGDLAARTAVANSALANVRRLEALKGFTRLSAPFDGVVTQRNAQIGALVSVGNTAAPPLFVVSDMHRMRIFVSVPQGYATAVRPGITATMALPEHPRRTFAATVTRTARAIDRQSGAILVQLEADNRDGALLPGAYAQVRFNIAGAAGDLRLPGTAILYRGEGPAVAVVDQAGTVAMREVRIARDEGSFVILSSGVTPRDSVIDSPPDSIGSGDRVRVVTTQPAARPAGG